MKLTPIIALTLATLVAAAPTPDPNPDPRDRPNCKSRFSWTCGGHWKRIFGGSE